MAVVAFVSNVLIMIGYFGVPAAGTVLCLGAPTLLAPSMRHWMRVGPRDTWRAYHSERRSLREAARLFRAGRGPRPDTQRDFLFNVYGWPWRFFASLVRPSLKVGVVAVVCFAVGVPLGLWAGTVT